MKVKSILFKCFACLLFVLTSVCPAGTSKIIYVDDDAIGLNDGTSWENAYTYLQDALTDANSAEKPIEIRVAQGTYKPDQGAGQTSGEREATFQLINGVFLAGGYAGIGADNPNVRDFELYETILSGDLNCDDTNVADPCDLLDEPSRAENSYHVVTSSNTNETAILDGFIITSGNANGTLFSGLDRGGGIYNYDSNLSVTNCIFNSNSAEYLGGGAFNIYNNNYSLENCIFSGNAASHGGGTFNCQSNTTMKNCRFSGNSAIYEGGGMYNEISEPTLIDCTFSENKALDSRGGGMKNYCTNLRLINCIFSENVSGYAGGGINNYHSEPVLNNCTFSGNMAMNDGGGMYNDHNSNSTLINCSFSDNSSKRMGGGIYNSSSDLIMNTCSFNGNQAGSDGGGINIFGGNTTLAGCSFINNRAGSNGGGMDNSAGNAKLTDCIFSDNYAEIDGGGINNYSINHTLINCIFSKNVAGEDGGGMKNFHGDFVMTDCSFNSNMANSGGGIYSYYYINHSLYNCTFRENSANYGGGIFSTGKVSQKNKLNFIRCNFNGNSACYGGGINDVYTNLKLTNCIFSGSSANINGGSLYNWNSTSILTNCTFAQNVAQNGKALACKADGALSPSNFELNNCILWNGGKEIWCDDNYSSIIVSYSNIQKGLEGKGNIDLDPLFANPGYWANVNDPNIIVEPDDPNAVWVDGDYHLKSQVGRWDPKSERWVIDSVTSPCIDAGDPNSPIYYEPIPNGGIINMGAYGGIQQASKSLYDVNMILDRARESSPVNGVTDVVLDVLLYWVSDETIVAHEVYFGEDNPPPFVRKQYESIFDPGALDPNTQYYWRIDDIDNLLNRITGQQWTFCTGPQPSYSYNPNPINGTDNVEFGAILTWNPGLNAIAHNVYLGTDLNDVYDATIEHTLSVLVSIEQDSNYYDPGRLEFNQTYYWRIDEIDNQGVVTTGNVWMFITDSQPIQAYNPYPDDEAVKVKLDSLLSWSAGLYAVSHDVYLGTNFNIVKEATASNPMGVLVSIGQDSNSYDPVLKPGQTYYWRIDEIDKHGSKVTGQVWEFRSESSPVKGVACFMGDTCVWIDGALIPISKVSAGQRIGFLDISGKVETVQEHEGIFTLYDVSLESGNYITVAENHFFMSESGQWLPLHDLKAGSILKTAKGIIGIISIKKRPELYIGKVYNLKIEGSDRYMVGEDAVIVRNY
jgi:predicted outer membrane repeat protein